MPPIGSTGTYDLVLEACIRVKYFRLMIFFSRTPEVRLPFRQLFVRDLIISFANQSMHGSTNIWPKLLMRTLRQHRTPSKQLETPARWWESLSGARSTRWNVAFPSCYSVAAVVSSNSWGQSTIHRDAKGRTLKLSRSIFAYSAGVSGSNSRIELLPDTDFDIGLTKFRPDTSYMPSNL